MLHLIYVETTCSELRRYHRMTRQGGEKLEKHTDRLMRWMISKIVGVEFKGTNETPELEEIELKKDDEDRTSCVPGTTSQKQFNQSHYSVLSAK